MESMLHELYFGNVNPCERKRVRDPEYAALSKKIDGIVVHFEELLSPEEYAKLMQILELRAEASVFEEAELFEYAFSLAVLLMLDVFGYRGSD